MNVCKICGQCGKEFPVLWPDLWAYKKRPKWDETIWYCSYGCMRKHEKGEKEAMEAKEAIKKDGTPAKRPGRKPKQTAEEKQKVELVYDPGIMEEYRAEQGKKKKIFGKDTLEVMALKSRVIPKGAYFKSTVNDGTMLLKIGEKDMVLKGNSWIALTAEILVALEQLGIRTYDEGRDTEERNERDQLSRAGIGR